MDLFQRSEQAEQDFFEQSRINYKCPLLAESAGGLLFQDSQLFFPRLEHLQDQIIGQVLPELSCSPYSRDMPSADDTNHLELFLGNRPSLPPNELLFQLQQAILQEQPQQQIRTQPQNIKCHELESVISFLVQNTKLNIEETTVAVSARFPSLKQHSMVKTLIDKFGHLKKTKEELVKYCMRKAFKFVLELPKNRDLLVAEHKEKLSFSKSKNRFLKKVSEEKSMNSKFLGQVFREGDFSQDYFVFLDQFQSIMEEDNNNKIKYLARMLSCSKEGGKDGSGEMVRRLPWTRPILQKVLKTARELLKFSLHNK